MDPGSLFASGFIAIVLVAFGVMLGHGDVQQPPVVKKEEEEKKVVEPPPVEPVKVHEDGILKDATIMWFVLPSAIFFFMMGTCKFFPLVLCGAILGRNDNSIELYIFQVFFLHLAYALFGSVAVSYYLWNLPSVAKKLSKKYAKERAKENRQSLSTPEAFLEAYLCSIKKETDRRAKILKNDHPLDNIGLQPWVQVGLYCLPLVPCFIGGWWAFAPLVALMLFDTVSRCKILRYCFRFTLGTNSLLKVDDVGLEYRFKRDPVDAKVEDKCIPEKVAQLLQQ
jgi:hypothetical protein